MFAKFSHFKLPLLLVAMVIACLLVGDHLPQGLQAVCYAISLTIKELLLFALPFIIFAFLFGSISSLEKNALAFVLLLLAMICLSNFISTWLAYIVGGQLLKSLPSLAVLEPYHHPLMPAWSFALPRWIPNDVALFGGAVAGIVSAFAWPVAGAKWGQQLTSMALWMLNRLFLPVIPFFILGFLIKLQHDQLLMPLFKDYLVIFLMVVGVQYSYILFLYGVASRFHPALWWASVQNMLPAMIGGFSAMSSAAVLPLTLLGAERNTSNRASNPSSNSASNPEVVRATIPATVSVHLVGDCFAIPIIAMALMLSFGMSLPNLQDYLLFSASFVLAKFAVAAVPGGGILVMLPVLEHYFHFSPDMLSLITALYIVFDPVVTSANIMGNGAFAMLMHHTYGWFKTKFSRSAQPLGVSH